jgi:hypothetical protein
MRNPRITITVTPAQADLSADLARLPRRDQAGRIRDLAMLGLVLTKGATVAPAQSSSLVPAAIQQTTTPNPAPNPGGATAQRARAARLNGRLLGGEV